MSRISSPKRRIGAALMAMALLLGVASLSACNTISGAGEDISAGGKHIENAAEDTKAKM